MQNSNGTQNLQLLAKPITNGNGHLTNGQNGRIHPTNRRIQDLKQEYDRDFQVTPAYKATLPDMQNTDENKGTAVAIQHVGIHNFKVPMKIVTRAGDNLQIHCSITGTVSLDAHKKGINMSRIMRTFYEYDESQLNPQTLNDIVHSYLENLESSSARIAIAFDYPLKQKSLRSGLSGYQYYPVVLETAVTPQDGLRQFMHLDFTYSSACPCS